MIGSAGLDKKEELIHIPCFKAGHGNDHLGQHIQGAFDGTDVLDILIHDPFGDDCGIQKIAAVGGIEKAAAKPADPWPDRPIR